MTITTQFNDVVTEARIAELSRQNALLLAQVEDLTALVREFPSKIISARLDVQEGKQTQYDYDRAQKACAVRI